jgi:hypothetical protein
MIVFCNYSIPNWHEATFLQFELISFRFPDKCDIISLLM